MKMFLWKACSNILPMKEKLFKRRITNDPLCPICGLATKSVGRIIWSWTTDVCLEDDKLIQKSSNDNDEFINIFEKLMGMLEEDDMQMFVFVAWQIWFRHNKAVFEGEFTSPTMVNRKAIAHVVAFRDAKEAQQHERPSVGYCVGNEWVKPPNGFNQTILGCSA